jgi:hypothetical protein
MKRTAVLLTALAVAFTPMAAEAAKKPVPKPTKRVVVWNYVGVFGATVKGTGGGPSGSACPKACFTLPTQKYERHITLSAKDSAGQKVGIQYFFDGDYANNVLVCSTGSFDIPGGAEVSFDTVATPECVGVPTTGNITITVTGKK